VVAAQEQKAALAQFHVWGAALEVELESDEAGQQAAADD
jgi:hypothetical protein